ncbi:glutamine amidotransferase-related protein, partial [Thermus scotoductus]|uniref:glutamine amidotransferase-related protein n=2 Tax=Thermus scotoductus TaxID=37636 RepID=UPI003F51497D
MVLVLDFGSQYTRLIARRLRELRVFSLILPGRASLEEILKHKPQALILSGGPNSVFDPDAPRPGRIREKTRSSRSLLAMRR